MTDLYAAAAEAAATPMPFTEVVTARYPDLLRRGEPAATDQARAAVEAVEAARQRLCGPRRVEQPRPVSQLSLDVGRGS